jgi:O-acetyl-ADP-ribose deacetylase (regulator of RNase III)
MKIIYKTGDLLKCEEKIIMHGCNCQGKMGAGIAKSIRQMYPEAYEHYKRSVDWHKKHGLPLKDLLGRVDWTPCSDRIILNAFTQEYYGRENDRRYVSYRAIRQVIGNTNTTIEIIAGKIPDALQHVLGRSIELPYPVALPKIGAGLANGDWIVISGIIEEMSTYIQPVVYSWEYDERDGK